MMNDNELMHYGVLGMKWGVHRGRVAQSYGKAVAKRNKLDKRVEVAKAKANTGVSAKYKKLQATADKYQRKADKKKYGFIPNQKKAAKLQVKADRARFKANKYKDKSERRDMKAGKAQTDYIRAQRKAQKWAKQMDKTFKGKNISQISKKHKDSGKNYVKRRVA